MKMVWVGCMCICHGGWIIKSWVLPAVTTLRWEAEWVCLVMDLAGVSKAIMVVPGGRTVRRSRKVAVDRSEEHTSEFQSLMRSSYAVFCLKKINKSNIRRLNLLLSTRAQ